MEWMELGWSVCFIDMEGPVVVYLLPYMDGGVLVCVLTWYGWSWCCLCGDLAWMEVGWSL